VGGAGSFWLGRDLNLLLWGDEVAQSLGCPVRAVRRWILVLSSLLAAASVAACGVVGFVGLMVPHLARGVLRTADHRYVLPGSMLLGAALTVAADTLARTVAAPLELPVGAITSALGAPFLVWLVARRHRRVEG
jgi:iron complex transport system permease protein